MIYLAAILSGASSSDLRLRRLASAVLRDAGEAAYDPASAISSGANDARGVVRVNQAALEQCDAVLALLPLGVSTFGTPAEVQHAVRLAIPLALIGGVGVWRSGSVGRVPSFWPTADGAREAVAWLRETLNRHQPSSPSSRHLESSSGGLG